MRFEYSKGPAEQLSLFGVSPDMLRVSLYQDEEAAARSASRKNNETTAPMELDPLFDMDVLMSEFSDTLFSTLASHQPLPWHNPREIGEKIITWLLGFSRDILMRFLVLPQVLSAPFKPRLSHFCHCFLSLRWCVNFKWCKIRLWALLRAFTSALGYRTSVQMLDVFPTSPSLPFFQSSCRECRHDPARTHPLTTQLRLHGLLWSAPR